MPLSDKETESLIEKIRGKYDEYAAKHSPRWFDRDAFEERLQIALRNKMDLEGFILAEIANFEKIKESYEKKKNHQSFSQQVDRIIEEHTEMIREYPDIEFHPKSGFEIRHMYGGLTRLLRVYLPILWSLLKEREHRDILYSLIQKLEQYGGPRGRRHAPRIEDHISLLHRPGVQLIEIEKNKNAYLRESAFVLHDISDFCKELLEWKEPEWETPLQFNSIHIEGAAKKEVVNNFHQCTGYGAILRILEYSTGIIENFRLQAFRQK